MPRVRRPPGAPTFFATPGQFRAWLEAHHATEDELLVGFHKVDSGTPSITWQESVDQALCFGWIDGIRRRIDERRYSIRFTPRRPGSNWSAINLARVKVLRRLDLMHDAGLAAWERRPRDTSRVYSYERLDAAALTPVQERTFRRARAAWDWFSAQPPSYRKRMLYWVTSARTEPTRQRRLERLIAASAEERRL